MLFYAHTQDKKYHTYTTKSMKLEIGIVVLAILGLIFAIYIATITNDLALPSIALILTWLPAIIHVLEDFNIYRKTLEASLSKKKVIAESKAFRYRRFRIEK